jgi:hypothetical protein
MNDFRTLRLLMSLMIGASFTIQQARAEPATLTLSCDGKVTNTLSSDNKTETVIKMGLLVNFANGTVMRFGTPARIKKADTISVNFVGDNGSGSSVQGTVDRITGSVIASTQLYSASSKKLITGDRWDLHCTPTGTFF